MVLLLLLLLLLLLILLLFLMNWKRRFCNNALQVSASIQCVLCRRVSPLFWSVKHDTLKE